jgi:hypothetical protein
MALIELPSSQILPRFKEVSCTLYLRLKVFTPLAIPENTATILKVSPLVIGNVLSVDSLTTT